MTRIERDALKDANARLDVDNKRMARELKRVTSSVDADARETSRTARSLQRRCDRQQRPRRRARQGGGALRQGRDVRRGGRHRRSTHLKRAAEAEKVEAARAVSEAKILRQEKTT